MAQAALGDEVVDAALALRITRIPAQRQLDIGNLLKLAWRTVLQTMPVAQAACPSAMVGRSGSGQTPAHEVQQFDWLSCTCNTMTSLTSSAQWST